MYGEKRIYQKVVHDITLPAELSVKRHVWSSFADYLLPKVGLLIAQQPNPRANAKMLRLDVMHLALDSLGTIVTIARMSGERDRELALSRLLFTGAASHLIDVVHTFGIHGTKRVQGQPLELALRAARHAVIAADDLRRAGANPKKIPLLEKSVLTLSKELLQTHPQKVADLFQEDGKNEIDYAIATRYQSRVRASRPYRF